MPGSANYSDFATQVKFVCSGEVAYKLPRLVLFWYRKVVVPYGLPVRAVLQEGSQVHGRATRNQEFCTKYFNMILFISMSHVTLQDVENDPEKTL